MTSVKARFDAQLSAADPANISMLRVTKVYMNITNSIIGGKVKSTGARESEPAGPAPAPAPKIPTPEPAPKTPTREPVTPKKPSKAGGNHEKSFDTPNIHSVIGKSLQRINFKSPVKDDIVEAVTPTKANKGSPFKRRRTNNSDSN